MPEVHVLGEGNELIIINAHLCYGSFRSALRPALCRIKSASSSDDSEFQVLFGHIPDVIYEKITDADH